MPETGAFDSAKQIVLDARPQLAERFHIWGGAKVVQLLADYPEIAGYYGHFLTPGHVLKQMYDQLHDSQASVEAIVRHLVVTQFTEQQHTKLEQAGSPSDQRPGIQKLFTDLPFLCRETGYVGFAVRDLSRAVAQNHTVKSDWPEGKHWTTWQRHPPRARAWFIKGGPGNGKSTISQFLCQIQRAALMLLPDSPSTTPQQRDVAREVATVAQSAGFWPAAPRIPVSVELKEFAKWFGDRNETQPKGVLTYLSERLSQRIEQPVQSGTLKRAFARARWLFVFDGLDEVPSDVKGLVAAEVVSFVDDLLIAQNSDALVICSSRPQGYSGQFDELSMAAVELVSLWPKLALECAGPVLRIDRTEEEAQQYSETLAEALQTPAIAEIMRTPLQAHIMAVVVRDGGRPPDRKWKLFTNFYQTIKRREANRNLPDKRLSVLLRAGEKLLKSLHNRLGFELHFRAETKSGAQTSLARKELGEVVDQTVRQLQESNVDETIRTLMTATTDRLVLVTTPETSDQVRFDIRPLQEFFAAEYLYEDVQAGVLGQRLEIISADAHWREVVHFLLSALIENSRQTELVVAIENLSNANDRGDGASRSLYRRLCVGGMVAARLLNEGVLEQDRRIRHQFRRCIEPIFGSTEVELLEPLATVLSGESLAWLLDIAADCLGEQTESESVGAAYLLCVAMPDDHPRTAEVIASMATKSPGYVCCLLDLLWHKYHLADFRRPQSPGATSWVACWLMKLLASPGWRELSSEGVRTAFTLLQFKGELLPDAARSVGFNEALSEIVTAILSRSMEAEPEHQTIEKFFPTAYYPPEASLRLENWTDNEWNALDGATGVFELIKPILKLAYEKEVSGEVKDLLEGPSREFLTCLPTGLAAFLPSDLQSEDFFGTGCDNQHGPITPVWRYKPGYYRDVKPEFQGADLAGVIRAHPTLALYSFDVRFDDGSLSDFLETPEGSAVLVAACLERPEVLRGVVGNWGRLIKLTEKVGQDIRPAILRAAGSEGDWSIGGDDYDAFLLDLPGEAAMLPPLMACLPFVSSSETSVNEPPAQLAVQQFSPDVSSLCAIARSDQFNESIRGAAAMMALLHPQCDETQSLEFIDTIVDCYRPKLNNWYLRAAGVALDSAILVDDPIAVGAMGRMIRIGMGDFEGRYRLNGLLSRWREESRAPVQKRGGLIFGTEVA
ncbi:NACHT domain-containing protein [Bradyrhizobium australafricanum]|uniref:NACHT domain-containing protein n=1 Tax=Bradyrhizobium australafricanum TaxID=2821406 RepID=UPI001CE35FE8|nr:hypothetical protein [Bradyrhizobium australafricanum]MCA6097781.1 hypothetical protein [Bradyrhizobium australafricanum]